MFSSSCMVFVITVGILRCFCFRVSVFQTSITEESPMELKHLILKNCTIKIEMSCTPL